MMRRLFALACMVAVAHMAGNANAAVLLDGQTVGYQYCFPDLSTPIYSPPDFVVGPGVELPAGLYSPADGTGQLDVSDTNLLVKFTTTGAWTAGSFNGFRLYDSTSTIAPITSVTVNPATNMPGFSVANVSFDANNIYVNWQGLPVDPSYVVSLDVNSTAAVPAPSTLVTWSGVMAVVALVGIVRRRQAASGI
jgi:hypothetical protein